jgi:translation initiation factor IF-2
MSDDPDEQTTLKAKAQALQKRYKEEEEALKAMEPSEEDKKKAADALKAQQDEEARLKAKRDAAQAKADAAPTGDAPAKTDAPKTDAPAGDTPAKTDAPEGDKPNRPESGKNSKDDMIKRYQELLAKTEDPEKKSKIEAKIASLQAESVESFDNAEFISILESELAEFSREIAESFGFQTATIADKFRKLL